MIAIQFPDTVPNVPTVPFDPSKCLDVWQPLTGRYVIKTSKQECVVVLRMVLKDRPFCIEPQVLYVLRKRMHIEIPVAEPVPVRLWAWGDDTPDEHQLWRCDKQRPDYHPELARVWTNAYITVAEAVCVDNEKTDYQFVVTVIFALQPKAIDPKSMPLAVEVDKVVMALSGKVPRYVTVERVPKEDTKATHTADGEVIADMGGKQPKFDFSGTTFKPVAEVAPAATAACDDGNDSTRDQANAGDTTDAPEAPAETPACDDGNDDADNLCMKCHAAPIDDGDTTWCSGCLAELKIHQEAQADARRQWLVGSAFEYLADGQGRTVNHIATWLKNAQYRFQPSWVAGSTIGALAKELADTLELDPRFDVCRSAGPGSMPVWTLVEPLVHTAPAPPVPTPEPDDPAPGSYAPPRPEHVDLGDLTIDHIVNVLRNSNGSLALYNFPAHVQQACKVNASVAAVRAVAAQHPDLVELGPNLGARQRIDLATGRFELDVAIFVRSELEGLAGKGCSLTALAQRVSKRWKLKGDSIGRAWLDKALLANPQWFVREPGKPVRLRAAVDG